MVLREEGRTLRQRLADSRKELVGAKTLLRRDREDRCLGQYTVPVLHQLLQSFLGSKVNLVDNQKNFGFNALHLVEEVGILVGVVLYIGHIEQYIGIHESRARELEHLLLELIVGLQHTWGVAIHHLEVIAIDDTHDTVASGLRLRGNNRKALAHQYVHQCGLAHIGIAYYIYKT